MFPHRKKPEATSGSEPEETDDKNAAVVAEAEAIAQGRISDAPIGGASSETASGPEAHAAGPQSAPTDSIDLAALGITQEVMAEAACALPQALASFVFKIQAPPMDEPLRSTTQKAGLLMVRDLAPGLERVPPWAGYAICCLLYLGMVGASVGWTKPENASLPDNPAAAKQP